MTGWEQIGFRVWLKEYTDSVSGYISYDPWIDPDGVFYEEEEYRWGLELDDGEGVITHLAEGRAASPEIARKKVSWAYGASLLPPILMPPEHQHQARLRIVEEYRRTR